MEYLNQIGQKAKKAAASLNCLGQQEKNQGILNVADALLKREEEILSANQKDIEAAREHGMKDSLIDRLMLNHERVEKMADGLREIAALKDPIGEFISMEKRPNGLQIIEKRVPLGVIGIIYESRPNVTADAFGLCFKTGNAVILRGGSDAIYSNQAIVKIIRETLLELSQKDCLVDAVSLIEDTKRETAQEFMRLNEYVDVLIPRGGASLIRSVIEHSTVPVIETGTGNCHVYVDEFADLEMALNIIENAKTQRLGVCNACESLVIHKAVIKEILPSLYQRLTEKQIVFRADSFAREICPQMEEAKEEDFATEYLDRFISIKVVTSIEEAIKHINQYNTRHSETIVTKDYNHAMKFTEEIDAAAVYVNASTRFTDGNEFGLGAEIGISTQKLHVRGPMGLKALTTSKFVILGNGQIRP